MGLEAFAVARQVCGNFASLEKVHHPARRLLFQYKHLGAPVALTGKIWTEGQWVNALDRGPYKSAE